MSTNGTPSHDERSPWTKPGFLAAAAVVALLVVLGLMLAFTGGSESDPQNPAATPPGPAGQPADAADPDDSACNLPSGDQAIPKDPPDAKWVLRGTFAVPRASPAIGPHDVDGAIPSCFAHSPTGALFAAVNIYAALNELSHEPPSNPREVIRQLIASGPGRDTVLRNLRAASKGGASSDDSSAGVQVAGFSVVRYEPTAAVIDIAFRVDRPGATGYVHAASTVRWERQDWRLVLAQDGRPFDSMDQIPNLNGYVPWSGV